MKASNIADFLDIFECPGCHAGGLGIKGAAMRCSNCNKEYQIISGIPDLTVKDDLQEESFSRWSDFYSREDKNRDDIGFGALSEEHVRVFERSDILRKISPSELVLDMGCGKGYISYGLSKIGRITVGVDFVFDALLFAKKKFEKENLSGLFVRCDMSNLPFKKESFGFIYSLGVLEHHRNIEEPAKEIFRTLKHGGYSFNVVPALSISSLTYAQTWGSIPNLPFIRDIFYWLHHKLLKARHCVYGFELNFLQPQLEKIFKNSGFSINKSGVFGITAPICSTKNTFLKSIAKALIKNRLFTRHIYIKSKKS